MRKLLLFAFIFLAACNKESLNHKSNGSVNYTIEGDTIQIADSASGSEAKWTYLNNPSNGYALEAYYAKPGGEVLYTILFYIKTNTIETGRNYSPEVTGTILKNSTDYASTQDIEGTSITIQFNKQKDQTLTGKFTGTLKNLTTNEFVEVSGAFGHVRLIK
jgi:hypothetical protein